MADMVTSPDDQEEFVILDEIGDFDALPALDEAGQDYLRGQGITSPETWSAFRLGTPAPAVLARLGLTGRKAPGAGGVSIPTWQPETPDRMAGLVRLTPGQHRHRFASVPAGIGGPITVATAPRVVLANNPLLALWLHQCGVEDVALVEEMGVLPPLAAWLRSRTLICAAHNQNDLQAMESGLAALGITATGVVLPMKRSHISPESRAVLGLPLVADVPDATEPKPTLSALILSQLHAYARSRLAAGEARQVLIDLELDHPDLLAAYNVGYLPPDYRDALPREAQRALVGQRCGNSLMFPATDSAGTIVDALIVRVHAPSQPSPSLWPEPRGLLAPALITGHPDLIVTDTVVWLGRLFRQGYRNVLLLRGIQDARRQAAELQRCGVKNVTLRVRHGVDSWTGIFQACGLRVTVIREPVTSATMAATIPGAAQRTSVLDIVRSLSPGKPSATAAPVTASDVATAEAVTPAVVEVRSAAQADALVCLESDSTSGELLFQAGPLIYAVPRREDGTSKRQVTIRCGGKAPHSTLDLAQPMQCKRWAGSVSGSLGHHEDVIAGHLIALWPAVLAREEADEMAPAVTVSAEERAVGHSLLDAPDLMQRVLADLAALGWLGEEKAKQVLYLSAISRLLSQPVWAVYQASTGAAPWQGVGCIVALTPPEAVTIFHRLTDSALTHADRVSLRHRLLVVDQAETLRPEGALALRVLHERGGIGWATAAPMAGGGTGETRGPVSVLAAAAASLDLRCRDAFLTVTVDETPGQTAAILADQRRRLAAGLTPRDASAHIIMRHHAAQRLLERLPVRVPFADRLIFPASHLRHRDEQSQFLRLIAASALLHQRQRPREAGVVLATEEDFNAVVACTAGLLGTEAESISTAARRLLSALFERKLTTFTMADLRGAFPEWTPYAYKAALLDLLDFGYIDSPNGGRGRLRPYRLVANAADMPAMLGGIRLRPAAAPSLSADDVAPSVGELAKVGDTGIANFAPRLTGS
ncbi:MAG: hypothetical protein H0W83_00155 [Planctomycetes bacterium]|nr:hypothetical protein [Planctomycetota bacterium]